ncbi:hypothetical protein, partial [Streptomyces sediminimaris]|uniref:hypothetical protein n=1 Tax=Streptomyces sediminimaris TaxID=3383721 RepID=UPI0039995E44
TTVDRYYLAWSELQSEHGDETLTSTRMAEQLSAHLATKDIHGRGGHPLSPTTLRRYLLPFRIYHLWAQHRQHNTTPTPQTIAKECTAHGITAQYNKPITTDHITQLTPDFERRWHTLTHQHTHQEGTAGDALEVISARGLHRGHHPPREQTWMA